MTPDEDLSSGGRDFSDGTSSNPSRSSGDPATSADRYGLWQSQAMRTVQPAARLDLRPLPPAVAAALADDRELATRLLGAALPAAWPQSDLLDAMPLLAKAGSETEGFGAWVMIERATNTVVGDVGFLGPPEDGVVEIGFSVLPDRRRRGYASEAVRALLEWVLRQPGVREVVARSDLDNLGSAGVLEGTGFNRTGEIDGQIAWALRSPGSSDAGS
jgi:ribosomal-protein-alanine N-acetyltransferase